MHILVCTWYRHVHPVDCLYMVHVCSPVSAGNISLMYAVCTHLYLAVPALDNAMVQESATWYIEGMSMYEPSKNGSGRWVAFLCCLSPCGPPICLQAVILLVHFSL